MKKKSWIKEWGKYYMKLYVLPSLITAAGIVGGMTFYDRVLRADRPMVIVPLQQDCEIPDHDPYSNEYSL